jgi:hypothetical protein
MPAKDRADLRTGEWKRKREYILTRDAFTCAYCGGEADTVDHILPHSLGGTSDPGNLISCCRRCNSSKSDRINTRLNCAALLGCSIYADEDECRQNETLDDAIEQGLEAGSGPDEAGAEDCSLAYYGFVLKKALVKKCRSLNVEERHFAASMKAFGITYQDEKVAFKASLTHGFGAPETSSPRSS